MLTSQPNLTLAPTSIAPVPLSPLDEVFQEMQTFVESPRRTLGEALSSFVLGGGTEAFTHPVLGLPVFNVDNLCGYNYSFQNKMVAEVRFGLVRNGQFLIQTAIFPRKPEEIKVFFAHFYHADGTFAATEIGAMSEMIEIKDVLMDARCPILNSLYQILSIEYAAAKEGTANTNRAHTIELFLRKIERTRKGEIAVNSGIRDEAVVAQTDKIMAMDLDPVLTWKERHAIFKTIKAERNNVLSVKRRAHNKSVILYQFPIHLHDLYSSTNRFIKRPVNNFFGVLDRIFIDPIRWFFKVVRNNMGYSIALGIYSPFTYFFITQPMNPHATWAVGKVRSAYIETTDKVRNLWDGKTAEGNIVSYQTLPQQNLPAPAPAPVGNPQPVMPIQQQNPTGDHGASVIETLKHPFAKLFSGEDNNYSRLSPSIAGLLLASDVVPVNEQSWEDRMSSFKAMQIAYEQNLEVAPRIGRLEQMETQLNWPLIVESTWFETERYLDQIKAIEATSHEYTPAFLRYVASEKARAAQMQMYLWDRNIRFILDHPYTMMDQSKEQTQMDYYVGRSFVLLKDMTQSLKAKNFNLLVPKGYAEIEKLADHFQADYKSNGGIFDRLKNNSRLFAQKDAMDTKELRAYMKRQWEVLFLLQNKAQEPSNFGLQLYNWSIRNAVWITQSVYSAKREELALIQHLFKKVPGVISVNNPTLSEQVRKIDSQYEALFHMMVLEYTSIRKEIGEHLKKDIEATQRRTIIGSMESFLKDREVLLKDAKVL